MPGFGQRGQQVRSGEETGAQVRPSVADQTGEPRGRPRAQVLRQQAEGQGPDNVRLGRRADVAVRGDELGLPGGPDARREACVAGGGPLAAEDGGDAAHEPRGAGVVGRGDVGLVAARELVERAGHVVARLQPLTPVEAGVPQVPLVRKRRAGPRRVPARRRHPPGAVQPADHVRPQAGEQLDVAVGAVDLPGHDHDRVAPARRAVEEADRAAGPLGGRGRGDVRDGPVVPLVGGDVAQPLGREAGHVVQERRGGHVQLPVAGPAGPFPVRAVGRDVAGVVAKAPRRRRVQRVDPVVAAGEPAGAPQVGMHDDAGDVACRQVAGVTLDPDVPEAVRGVPGFEGVAVAAGGDDAVDHARRERLGQERHGRAQVIGGDVAGRVQCLAVDEGEFGAGRAEVAEPDPAVDVLPEVGDQLAAREPGHRAGGDLLDAAHRG
jgi:hypothetical protein